jgi:phage terminase large subunit
MQQKIVSTFKPYPWQVPVWKDKSKILLLDGGAGGGKSKVIGEKYHALMKHYPNSTGLILRKNREAMTNSTILFLEREVMQGDSFVRHRPGLHRFEYTNGSVLAYGGMKDESQRGAIRSIGQKGGVDFCWMEEANQFTEDDFNEVSGRMRGNSAGWRQTCLTTNPDHPEHWINKRFILPNKARRIVSFAKDNPANDQDYLDTLSDLTGAYRDRLLLGLWVKAEGVIYKEFSFNHHVIEASQLLKLVDYKRVIFCADSNFPKPRGGLLLGFWGPGKVDIIDEFYQERSQPEDLGKWLERHTTELGRGIEGFHDPSDAAAIDTLNTFRYINCQKAMNAVLPGIAEVSRYFIEDLIRINKNCTNFISEIQGYIWKKGTKEEVPVKDKDHLMDAIRYGLFSIKAGSPQRTSVGKGLY